MEIINVANWIDSNRSQHGAGQMKLFFVGGPNTRKDYHIEEGEELFYQLKGDMTLKVVEMDKHRDITIKEGQVFLLPGRVPHSPQRKADTIGLVVERERMKSEAHTEMDGLRYFIEENGVPTLSRLYEDWFHCTDLQKDLPPVIKKYFASEEHRTGQRQSDTVLAEPPFPLDVKRKLLDPFDLKPWIERHRTEIDAGGCKALFDDATHQLQVFVCGNGPASSHFHCAAAETWIWQMKGSGHVKKTDGTTQALGADDSLHIACDAKFTYTGTATGSIALVVYQDPTLKNKAYCDGWTSSA